MAHRTTSPARARRAGAPSLDLVILTPLGATLGVLVARARGGAALPVATPGESEAFDGAARRLARAVLGREPAWLTQAGAWDGSRRHPDGAAWSVGYVGVVPPGADPAAGWQWVPLGEVPALAPRHKAILEGAVETVRGRMDAAPVAFRLLAPTFTLSELQQVYELLLGRRLHKASFRRALQAAFLVEPTEAWRSEGRGRPAQLYRYAPRRRRPGARAVRFDLLG